MGRSSYRLIRRVYRIGRWFRLRLTTAGRFVLATLIGTGVIAIDVRLTLAYQIAGLAAALLLLAYLANPRFRLRFSARRELPEFATAGESLEYRVSIRNLSPHTQRGLYLREAPRDELPSFEQFTAAREPGEERRNWFDRKVGYPRWVWLVSQTRGAEFDSVALPPLPPRGEITVKLPLRPTRRGIIGLSGLALIRSDPLGLVQSAATLELPQELLALPRRLPIERVEWGGSRHHQPGGVNQAASVGDAEEFLSLRAYRPGDPLRDIHWRSWARTGEPVVKEYQEEFFVRYGLLLDTYARPGQAMAFEDAVSLAASHALRETSPDALLDLMFVGAQAYRFTSGRGLLSSAGMLEILASVSSSTEDSLQSLGRLLSRHAERLSGCVCILLGWDEQRRRLIQTLRATGMELEVIVVADDEETDDSGPMHDLPYRFRRVAPGTLITQPA